VVIKENLDKMMGKLLEYGKKNEKMK